MSSPGQFWSRLFEFNQESRQEEIMAAAKFALVVGTYALLPNREFEVLYGLNPRHVWIVIVFVTGVSFFGYLLSKLIGPAKGVGITGFVGGCIASTPTVVSMAEKAKRNPEMDSLYTFSTVLACIAMIGKMFAVTSLVSFPLARSIFAPILGMLLVSVAVGLISWRQFRSMTLPDIELDGRFRLKPAFLFGAFVALVLIGVELTDITAPGTYVGLGVISAILNNLLFKIGISWAGGTEYMTRMLTGLFVLNAIAGLGVALIK